MTVVDTSVWIEYFGGRQSAETDWLHLELTRRRIVLLDLVLCEVLQGIRHDEQYVRVRNELLRLPIASVGGSAMALTAAANYRDLRARGITVRKTVDCLIATFCMARGHDLLHCDRDFDAFEKHLGLQVVQP